MYATSRFAGLHVLKLDLVWRAGMGIREYNVQRMFVLRGVNLKEFRLIEKSARNIP